MNGMIFFLTFRRISHIINKTEVLFNESLRDGDIVMFCPKCGKKIKDGAAFCAFCGMRIASQPDSGAEAQSMRTDTSTPAVNSAQQNGAPYMPPQPPQYQAQQPQPPQYQQYQPQYPPQQQWEAPRKKKLPRFVIPVSVTAGLLAVGVTLLFVFKPWEAGNALPVGNTQNGSASVSSAASTRPPETNKPIVTTDAPTDPVVSEKTPELTVNGKKVTLDITALCKRSDLDAEVDAALFSGREDNQLFGVMAAFAPNILKADTSYNQSDFGNDVLVMFSYCGRDYESYSDGYYNVLNISSDDREMTNVRITVGSYQPNRSVTITVSGNVSYDGLNYDFEAVGSLDFEKEIDDLLEEWYDNNRIPVESVSEITIGGERYSTDLTYLDLSGKGLNNYDLQNLIYMTKLERIELSDNNLSDISVLGKIPSLREIDADNNSIEDISFLEDLPNIEIVVMNNNRIKDISVFLRFTTIKKIWMCDNQIGDISPIAQNKGLTEFGINGSYIYDISALYGMTRLEILCAYGCGLTDISPLSECTNLRELHIGGNNISDFSPIENLNIENISLE